MTVWEYAVEAMIYRTAGLIDGMLQGSHKNEDILAALEEFAIEASILKVASSEMIDFVLDENVQIHGGNGFVRDYPAERHYRDARVNRIFEGTNEINRMLIPGMLIRRALKGGLPIIAAAKRLQEEILVPSMPEMPGDAPLENERRAVAAMKKAALMVVGTALQTYGEKLTDQQEVLMTSADIIMDVYGAESALLRAAAAGGALHQAAAEVFVNDAAGRVEIATRNALASMADGDTLRTLLAALRRVMKVTPVNAVARRRQIADAVIERKGYPY
jgi:alkylation response protein AidB-like acyl-CoA dehydrogenase